jgi:hypothetical protein
MYCSETYYVFVFWRMKNVICFVSKLSAGILTKWTTVYLTGLGYGIG